MATYGGGPDPSYIAGLVRVRAAAGALIRDEADRVLVVHPVYKDEWEIPGGTLEADESPREACRREIKEELGVDLPVGAMLCVDWVPPAPPWDGGLMFIFDAGVMTSVQAAGLRLEPSELDRCEFVVPQALDELLIPRLARRVSACVSALNRGAVYLEDGIDATW